MIRVVHHVPGRLRIRNLRIKGSASDAARYCDVVRCLPGVYGAKASAVTGSILIEYHLKVTCQRELLALLGAKAASVAQRPHRHRAMRGSAPVERIAEKLGQALAERLIERSARALIAALI